MRYPVTLVAQSRQVRDPGLIVRMPRFVPQPAAKEPQAAAVAPIPAGTDRWYDALTNALIPWRPIIAETAPDTPNYQGGAGGGSFTWDDDREFEGDIVDGYYGSSPGDGRSAWWALRVPSDAPEGCTLTIDNFKSTIGPDSTDDPSDIYRPDLYLNLVTTDVDPIPTSPLPSADLDFSLLYQVAYNEDTADDVTGKQYCSIIGNFPLIPGKTYWIRTDLYSPNFDHSDDVIYRARFTLTIPA